MAALKFGGKEYELPDSASWTVAELSEAEHALGVSFGEESQGDAMAVSFFIAVRRVDKTTEAVALADRVRQIPIGALVADEEAASPLADDHGDPQNGGLRPLEVSESLSP